MFDRVMIYIPILMILLTEGILDMKVSNPVIAFMIVSCIVGREINAYGYYRQIENRLNEIESNIDNRMR